MARQATATRPRTTPLAPRRVSGQWLASALHGTMLRGYANRMNGAHSLDIHLKWYRWREGRDAACAQLRALAHSTQDTVDALQPSGITCPTSLIVGACDPYLKGTQLDRLVRTMRDATNDNTVVNIIPGAAHMIPEEASHLLAMHLQDLLAREE